MEFENSELCLFCHGVRTAIYFFWVEDKLDVRFYCRKCEPTIPLEQLSHAQIRKLQLEIKNDSVSKIPRKRKLKSTRDSNFEYFEDTKKVIKTEHFQCQICLQDFLCQMSMNRHLEAEHNLEWSECEICHKWFDQKDKLLGHKQTMHPKIR